MAPGEPDVSARFGVTLVRLSDQSLAQLAVDHSCLGDAALEQLMPLATVLAEIESAHQEATLHDDLERVAEVVGKLMESLAGREIVGRIVGCDHKWTANPRKGNR